MYHYLESCVDCDVLIYHFYPHGSKEIDDLSQFSIRDRSWFEWNTSLLMVMHDQEPLNFDYYNEDNLTNSMLPWFNKHDKLTAKTMELVPETKDILSTQNLNFVCYGRSIYDKTLICHSEQRSENLKKYQENNMVGVYWWSHAIISRDWYRYAELDPSLVYANTFNKDFNIYNRAWSGSREYRVKFTDLLVENNLINRSNIKFSTTCDQQHYQQYLYKNPKFIPNNDLSMLPEPTAASTYSADYSANDYKECWFDVVLETLFDDQRLHITEKTLRPIACGKPFILTATHGSLDYLRSYGFKTFGDYIDESYDSISDPYQRLEAIIQLMTKISMLSLSEKEELNKKFLPIIKYNQQRFFSKEFSDQVINEFKTNYKLARDIANQHCTGQTWKFINQLNCTNPEIKENLFRENPKKSKADIIKFFKLIKS